MMTAHIVELIELVSLGQIDDVRNILEVGCDVNETNYDGDCAVTICAEHNEPEILRLLIAAKANVDVVDPIGRSALSRAEKLQHHEVAKLIKDALLEQKKAADSSLQAPKPTPASDSSSTNLKLFDKNSENHHPDELKQAPSTKTQQATIVTKRNP